MGDAIVEINGKTIKSTQDFYDVLNMIKSATMLKMLISERLRTIPNYEAILKLSFQCNKFSIKKLNLTKKKRSNSLNNIESLINELVDEADIINDKTSYYKKTMTSKKNLHSSIMKKIAKANANRMMSYKHFSSSLQDLHKNEEAQPQCDHAVLANDENKNAQSCQNEESDSSSTATITAKNVVDHKIIIDQLEESNDFLFKRQLGRMEERVVSSTECDGKFKLVFYSNILQQSLNSSDRVVEGRVINK